MQTREKYCMEQLVHIQRPIRVPGPLREQSDIMLQSIFLTFCRTWSYTEETAVLRSTRHLGSRNLQNV
jgi:hypothetical protein